MKQTEESFGREVDAEINALVAMSRNDGNATERLRVILQRSPDRFAQLVTEADDDRTMEDLALLLHRLEGTGIEGVLACCFSENATASDKARRLLAQFVKAQRPGQKGVKTWLAGRGIYALLDKLTASPVSDIIKVKLLVEWLGVNLDEQVARLVVNTLLCYPDDALCMLLARFWSARSVKELNRCPDVLQALTRFGTRFASVLVGPLASSDEKVCELALGGADAYARCYALSSLRINEDPRIRRNWCPLDAASIDPAVVEELAGAVAVLVSSGRSDVRNQAIRTLGLLRSVAHLSLLASLARGEDEGAKGFAIRAIAEIADPRAAALLNELARGRCHAAIEALGRCPSEETVATLVELMWSTDEALHKPALIALSNIDPSDYSPDALASIELAQHWDDKVLAYVATKMFKTATARKPLTREQSDRRKRIAGFVGRTEQPAALISVELAFRALPSPEPCGEMEFTRAVASVCSDFASTRRYMVEEGLVSRDDGVYTLTDAGSVAWRVERFIRDHYGA